MFTVSAEKFIEYVNDEASLEILINDKFIKIKKIPVSFTVTDNTCNLNYGFSIDKSTYKTEKRFLSKLKKLGLSNTVIVNKINSFDNIAEYEEDVKFKNADMEYLLNKYADCNIFALCAYYCDNHISKEDARSALDSLIADNKNYLFLCYEKFKSKYKLPPFETLYQDVKQECLKSGANAFICDKVYEKKTKYHHPRDLFWHFYNTIGHEIDSTEYLKQLIQIKNDFSVLAILEQNKYSLLKNFLISTEITFCTHCTKGSLQIVYKFALNDITKKWLLSFKTDYDFYSAGYELQDLAFYKDNKLRFSSCSHERHHDDIK